LNSTPKPTVALLNNLISRIATAHSRAIRPANLSPADTRDPLARGHQGPSRPRTPGTLRTADVVAFSLKGASVAGRVSGRRELSASERASAGVPAALELERGTARVRRPPLLAPVTPAPRGAGPARPAGRAGGRQGRRRRVGAPPNVTCRAGRPPALAPRRCSRPRVCGWPRPLPPRCAPGTEGSGPPCSGSPSPLASTRRLLPSLLSAQAGT
jgi:hypothetical protein